MTSTSTFPATLAFGYYNSFFHDGGVKAIVHIGNAANILLNSCEIEPYYNRDSIALNALGWIDGVLLIRGIQSITVNDEPYLDTLKMKSMSGDLMDLDFASGVVELGIGWDYYPFPSSPRMADFSYIIIKADQILWEDGPNNVTIDLTDLRTKKPRTS